MTIEEMRQIVGLPSDASDYDVVMAFAGKMDSGLLSSVTIDEPVTPAQLRAQCRIDEGLEDGLVSQKIRAAREWVEDYTTLVVAQRSMAARFSSWSSFLTIARRPIQSIDAIAYDGIEGGSVYSNPRYTSGSYPLKIYPSVDGWPRLVVGGNITVIYSAGYGVDEVPNRVVEAILVLAAGMMSQREGGYESSLSAAKSLLRLMRPARV